MSANETVVVSAPLAAVPATKEITARVNPATGALWVDGGGGGVPSGAARPVELIAPGVNVPVGVIQFTSANNGTLLGAYWQVPATAAAGSYAQLHDGTVALAGGERPIKRSPVPVIPGQEYAYEPPFGLQSGVAAPNDGFQMVLSTTQETYTAPAGAGGDFQPRATGIF